MLAIDTNIVVRYLTGDHAEQSARARALIDRQDVFISLTVVLESEWVLRSVYAFSAQRVAEALRAFAGLPRVTVEDPARLALALDRAAEGMDFADALHLGAASGCEAMLTFDRDFVRTAKTAGGMAVRPA
ncbi:tRNA(fMet)-specific endonuclease VapC [Variibacter gotjawalensis]|uniref:tRNA(FMet)-specific endonuclease VapC n=1 Tax=Variibacter gotjawalensis TaxID=1333996 RepID=A0A0S3PV80_9BRAD|nr:type II toxin-antitoxin system VapC family toxin [Variibacter gotjawalensis]NIK50160.1 putative nucleic-acid-binding protein [Variibacter gotjawalensis]RZS46156.1 putative nucleic-acid-binding protein [Variibacter gotjawalensis]BAT59832.1 tRNA(fMet)-specific endonuclease VapC [Variibacter gotjawalensis]